MQMARGRLIVVSNRLPVSITEVRGHFKTRRSSGGLVSALEPLLQEQGGIWIGSPGSVHSPEAQRLLTGAAQGSKYRFSPVDITEEEYRNFYLGFSNEIVWPLFHDLQSRCNFDPEYWRFYREVNRKFATTVKRIANRDDLIWIHDYQLMQVGSILRSERPTSRLAFFLHIPFPAPDIFEKLPWRREVLEGLLEHDLVGLQTRRDERNLIACLRSFVPSIKIASRDEGHIVISDRWQTHIGFFPISVDFRHFEELASSVQVVRRMRDINDRLPSIQIALGVDRLDYTKGIPERLRAYRAFLRTYPEFHGRVVLFQIVVPSRESIPRYRELKNEVEQLVAQINGEFGVPGWIPINYIHRSIARDELVAIYRAADVALITPLKDGMNLVAKEYCASKLEADGVLILSEFAGAASELRAGALLVNPYDESGVSRAINEALRMDLAERRRRMTRMRAQVRHSDVIRWRDRFFAALRKTSAGPQLLEPDGRALLDVSGSALR